MKLSRYTRPCFRSAEMVSKKNEGFQYQQHNTYNPSKKTFQEKNKIFFKRLLSQADKLSAKYTLIHQLGAGHRALVF
jgi:hypothetical protein